MNRTQSFTGIVLKKRPFFEDTPLITILTNEGFKIECIAKGLDSSKSKRRAHVECLNLVSGTLYESRSQSYLQEVICLKSHSALKDQLELLLRMQVVLEIIDRSVFEGDAHPEIYTLLENSLAELNEAPHPLLLEATLIRLAHLLGFLPSFKRCAHCHQDIVEDKAHWNDEDQTLHCENCKERRDPFPLKYRKILEFFREESLNRAHLIRLSKEEHETLRSFLPKLFLNHMNQPLKSLALVSH